MADHRRVIDGVLRRLRTGAIAVGPVEWTISVDATVNQAHQHAVSAPLRAPAACWWARTSVESAQAADRSTPPTASECCCTWTSSRSHA
jgi:hypothetical protein